MDTKPTTTCIVAGVDLTPTGDHALLAGMHLARQLPASDLHVVHVVHTNSDLHSARKLDKLSDQFRTKLEELRGRVASVCAPSNGGEPISQEIVFHLRFGDPVEMIHQTAVDVDADLIVVGTRGLQGVERLVLGSVAETLVRTARAPVLVAHPKDYSGLLKTERLDPARPGEQLHATGIAHRSRVTFTPRTFTHQSGLY